MHQQIARFGEDAVDGRLHLAALLHAKRGNAHGASDCGKIRIIGEVHFAVAPVMEKFLPLADHAQHVVIEEQNLDRQVVAFEGGELLQVHHDRTIAGYVDYRGVGTSHLCADRRG